jgi:hypothetical protein
MEKIEGEMKSLYPPYSIHAKGPFLRSSGEPIFDGDATESRTTRWKAGRMLSHLPGARLKAAHGRPLDRADPQ